LINTPGSTFGLFLFLSRTSKACCLSRSATSAAELDMLSLPEDSLPPGYVY
jgi:hypothetical protein